MTGGLVAGEARRPRFRRGPGRRVALLGALGIAALTTGLPLLAGLVLAMTAIYGQVVINDAMIARYVPPIYRARAYSVRYFVGFTVSGFVVPAIALLHERGGFALVLGVASACGASGVRPRTANASVISALRTMARRCRVKVGRAFAFFLVRCR